MCLARLFLFVVYFISGTFFRRNMDIEKETVSDTGDASVPTAKAKLHDELWGRLIIGVLLIGVLCALGFVAFLGYRAYEQRSDTKVSIVDVSKVDISESESTPGPEEEVREAEENPSPEPSVIDAKKTKILVLNGGAAKGSAGAFADFLEKAGYTAVTVGNADGNYSSVTVFHQEGSESAAKAVLADVAKKSPKATLSVSDKKNAETMKSEVVVIVGK